MIGIYLLWLFVGECALFICALAYGAIEEAVRERRGRRAGATAQASTTPRAPGQPVRLTKLAA